MQIRILLAAAGLFFLCNGFYGFAQAENGPVYQAHTTVELIPQTESVQTNKEYWVALRMTMDEEWHTYWRNPGDSGMAVRIKWDLPIGIEASDIYWPPPYPIAIPPLMSYGYEDTVYLLTKFKIFTTVKKDSILTVKAKVQWLTCKIECVPGDTDLDFLWPLSSLPAQPNPHWNGAIEETIQSYAQPNTYFKISAVESDDVIEIKLKPLKFSLNKINQISFYPYQDNVIDHAHPQTFRMEKNQCSLILKKSDVYPASLNRLQGELVFYMDGERQAVIVDRPLTRPFVQQWHELWIALIFAFLGGIILNAMPCVFPVLSIKVLHLLETAHNDAKMLIKHSLLFCLGVLTAFWCLLLLLFALRFSGYSIGWGFQFQSPVFLIIMAVLLFLFGLNLLGLLDFKISMPQSILKLNTGTKNWSSFGNGLLTTILATPCTAPFMGAAVGFAFVQPIFISFIVFTFLGMGLAFPYILLSCFPQVLRKLPKPGPWMVNVRKILSIPLFITGLWLLSLFVVQIQNKPNLAQEYTSSEKAVWRAYSYENVQAALQAGNPVFIDFTAAWCLTCQVNKKLVLTKPEVLNMFEQAGVVLFRADWTHNDPAVTEALAQYGKSSIPVYVYYSGNGKEPILLPELLTIKLIRDLIGG